MISMRERRRLQLQIVVALGFVIFTVEKDFFGNELKPFKNLTKKPLEPSSEEISTNSRARSAKMRVAEKL